jgi:NADH dehydrogenase
MTFKEILQRLLKLIDKKRLLIPIPLIVAKLMTQFFQLFPKPLLTLDQLKLLKYDNLLSGNYKSNLDIGYNCKLKFEEEVEKYCYMWREAGQFSKKDLNVN